MVECLCMHRALGSTSSTTFFFKVRQVLWLFLFSMDTYIPCHPRGSQKTTSGVGFAFCLGCSPLCIPTSFQRNLCPPPLSHRCPGLTEVLGLQVSNSESSLGSPDPNSSPNLCSASIWSTKPSPSPHLGGGLEMLRACPWRNGGTVGFPSLCSPEVSTPTLSWVHRSPEA